MIDAMKSLGLAEEAIERLADRVLTMVDVSWSDVRDAGIPGRDIVQARQQMVNKVWVWMCVCVCVRACLFICVYLASQLPYYWHTLVCVRVHCSCHCNTL